MYQQGGLALCMSADQGSSEKMAVKGKDLTNEAGSVAAVPPSLTGGLPPRRVSIYCTVQIHLCSALCQTILKRSGQRGRSTWERKVTRRRQLDTKSTRRSQHCGSGIHSVQRELAEDGVNWGVQRMQTSSKTEFFWCHHRSGRFHHLRLF